MTDGGSDDDKKVVDLRSLTKRRSEKLNEGIEMPARAPKQEMLIEVPPPPQLTVPPMTPPRAAEPAPAAAPGAFKRPRIKQKERTDLPRQTYYVDAERHDLLKYWGLMDARPISDIVREAIDAWIQNRELEESRGEGP